MNELAHLQEGIRREMEGRAWSLGHTVATRMVCDLTKRLVERMSLDELKEWYKELEIGFD